MIAEALKLLNTDLENNLRPAILKPEYCPENVWYLYDQKAESYKRVEEPLGFRDFTFPQPADLFNFVRTEGIQATLFLSPTSLRFVRELANKSSWVGESKLSPSPALAYLQLGHWLDPAAFRRELTVTLHNCINEPGFKTTVANLKFTKQQEVSANVGQTKDTMGRSIAREASGAGQIPETLSFLLQPWSNVPDFTVTIKVAVEIDLDDGELRLAPLAGELDRALRLGLESIAAANNTGQRLHFAAVA